MESASESEREREARPLLRARSGDANNECAGSGRSSSVGSHGRGASGEASPSDAIETSTPFSLPFHDDEPFLDRSDREEEEVAFERRNNEHAISNCDTIIHLLKGNIGTGILAMPDAIKNSGLLVGNVGLVIIAVICVHCMHMLVACAQSLCHRTRAVSLSYAQVAEAAFSTSSSHKVRRYARAAKIIINIFLCITQVGFCCVYFVFCAQNLKLVLDQYFGSVDYHVYMVAILGPMLMLCSVRNLKYLAPFSMLANFLQFIGLGLIFFYLLQDLPKTWDRKYFASWDQLPLYFGTAIYAFEGIGVVLPLENQMRTPRELRGWNGVLNTSMVIVACLYVAVGFFGYLKYGDLALGSITLNLPVNEWLAKIVILVITVAIFFSYALQFYVPLEILLPVVTAWAPSRPLLAEFALRYSLVILTFCLASAIPRLDLFISLVGAVSSSTLALLAPPVIETVTYWQTMTRRMAIKNMAIFTFGFTGFILGSYVSISNIINYFISGQ